MVSVDLCSTPSFLGWSLSCVPMLFPAVVAAPAQRTTEPRHGTLSLRRPDTCAQYVLSLQAAFINSDRH